MLLLKILGTVILVIFCFLEALWPLNDEPTPLSWKLFWGLIFIAVSYFIWS